MEKFELVLPEEVEKIKINELIDENKKLREAVSLIASQVDYISGGHNLGITNQDEHYIAILKGVNSILND